MPGSRQHELDHEQGVVDILYARLDALRAAAHARLRAVRREGPSGSPQNRSERDAFATLYEDRVAQLDGVEERLVFGRLDLQDGTTRYVGRIGLTDDEHVSLLTDWRAPAAQSFYRATAAQPDDVRRRRHLVTRARTVRSVEDEVLDLRSTDHETAGLSGEGALLASLSAGRTARMHDIVATIQREQDEIIRSPLAGALVVQGGPGTGKTAVALHRTAYLLYAHRRQLERSGVLVVGPSRSFLRYIDQVLPSLGETGVVSSTIGDLLPGVTATAVEDPAVTGVKGRAVWKDVVARAVRARQRVPAQDVTVRLDGHVLTIRRSDVRDAQGRARRAHRPHNEARGVFVKEMLRRLADQYAAAAGLEPGEVGHDVLEDLRAHRDVRVTLNLAWLPITPQRLVEDLWTKPHRLAEAAPELTAADRALLARPAGAPWTDADVPLLDEAAELLGEDDQLRRAEERAAAEQRAADLEYARQVLTSSGAGGGMVDAETLVGRFTDGGPRLTTAERAATDRRWAYGHVVVDEAQELSAMAWRMLLRRCPTRSFTIVGDVAQTSSPAGTRSWARTLRPVFRDAWHVAELTVNYRTPAEVARAGLRVARAAGLPTSTLESAREVGGSLVLRHVAAGTVVTAAASAADELALELVGDEGGRVAVVTTRERVGAVHEAVVASLARTRGPGVADALTGGPEARVVVLDPVAVKGLEFDAVVLVEPDEILAGTSGASDLYVAMTRPTQRLVVVHERALPPGLSD
ncbi:DNA helicase IV [Luteimicrobium subarcticum]|uniref:DNA helicase IV n=1 Tax=Luteimicrobium subarcticum TaxID=620910 RepID=A0A2M8WU24_9MICO|nr:DNA helicase IV [Luteimicrobium subarcticum]